MSKGNSRASSDSTVQLVSLENSDRIDCRYHDKSYYQTIDEMKKIASSNKDYEFTELEKLLDNKAKGKLTGGATPLGAVYLADGILFVRVQNVTPIGLDLTNAVFIGRVLHEGKLARSQIHPSDVLLTITGATFGNACIVPSVFSEANINQHVVKIILDKAKMVPDFLAYFLNSRFGRRQMDRNATGGTRLALDYDAIRALKVIKPSLDEQAGIIVAVKKIYDEAQVIKARISQLERSYDSIVLGALGIELPPEPRVKTFETRLDQDRLEVKWYYPYFDQIMSIIGKFKTRKLAEYQPKLKYGASLYGDYNGEIPFLRIENLRPNFIDANDLQFVSSSLYGKEVSSLYVIEGDILIGRSGAVGICSYVKKGFETFVHGSYIIRLRYEDPRLNQKYLSIFLNSTLGQLQFSRQKTGNLQYNINVPQIKDLSIIEPSLDLQDQIATETFRRIDEVAIQKAQYEKKLEEAKNQYDDLLQGHARNIQILTAPSTAETRLQNLRGPS